MSSRFNNCIALGVADKQATAERFVRHFGGAITRQTDDFIEVTTGPYCLYFVEDGTRDIAFSIDVTPNELEPKVRELEADGFVVDQVISERVGETFVRDPNGILINVFPVARDASAT